MPQDNMAQVFCPKTGQMEWANRSGKDPKGIAPKCTKCGLRHAK